jgi:large subunit ribosomal protein L10
MPTELKAQKLEEINEALSKANSVFITDFSGLTVEEVTRLRKEFRKNNVKYIVVKNTLARISAKQHGFEKLTPYLNGPTGMAIAMGDPTAPVRVIFDFKKDKEKPAIRAAVLEGQLLDKTAAELVRNIPPREVLLGMVVSAMAAPISGFIGGLQQLISKLAYTISAIKEQKEKES